VKSSIRTQMMLFFSLLIVAPILLSSVNVYYALQNYLKQSYVRHQSRTMDNLAGEIGGFRRKLEDLSLRVFGDRDVQSFLGTAFLVPSAEQLEKLTRFRTALQSYGSSTDPAISLFIVKGTSAIYGDALTPELERYIQLRIPEADAAEGAAIWDNVPGTGQIALFRRIQDNRTDLNRPLGYLFLIVSRTELDRIVGRYTLDAGQQFAVYDRGGGFAVRTDASLPLSFIREEGERLSAAGHETRSPDGERIVLFAEDVSGWKLLSWIPQRLVLAPARKLFLSILFTALALILFSVFMVLFLSHRLTRPLKMIQRKMKQIGEGRFILRMPVVRDDEVGELANALNRMSDEIQSLIRKNQEEETKRRLIQLQTLEYQINPHFLYNTLDSVNMLARKHNDPVIADIVTYLSRLFRIGLNQGREMITVDEEIRHVTYYLKIQEIRFAGQLFWDIQADESVGGEKIIKFLLQPLAENSINHGIRKRDEPGHIYIRVWGEPEAIVMEVEDDGVGMDAGQLARVTAAMEDEGEEPEQERGFGLRNVHQRIRLHDGPEYGLSLASAPGFGTTVTVRLPRRPAGE